MYMWILLLCLSFLVPAPLWALPVSDSNGTKAQPDMPPTNITAKKMTVRNQESQAVFEGAVVLTQGTLVVQSDKMIVFFYPKTGAEPKIPKEDGRCSGSSSAEATAKADGGAPSSQSVKQIEATGHVKIERDGGRATSNKAVFDNCHRIVTLTGDPVAWEKGTRVSGEKIILYLDEDRSVVEGGTHLRIEGEGGGQP